MDDPGMIIAPLAVIAAALAAAAIYFARAWVQAREREVRLRGEIERLGRFAQFEHGLDAVAIEVERLGEMQRFVAKQAMERQPKEMPRAEQVASEAGRILTPH